MMTLISTLIAQTPTTCDSVWGCINTPPGVANYGAGPEGLIIFASNIIKLITVIAGIWSLFNLIFAGFKYITAANDVKAVETAWTSIYMSLIGLIIIVSSFTIAALVGFLFFGDPTFIISPKIYGAP